ncbi:CRP-like cAMP-binding protein [Chitinophaga niastensis]|uniref:CRP-like cAMP-binding protein n=1 Tax=Chitinophaga niastensis TaxID=536980 RepID=A0A2P8HIJ7_CHINA|nr:Crp/Fnr family transcriptional regulator [Chitinophaga niastensis]PSL46037.1 CRP-like cAMP-binding protein [Chitinophaga niastensis]
MKSVLPLYNYLQLFRPIPAADWDMIQAALSVRTIKEGTELLREGKIAKEMFFVCKGVLRIVKRTEEGNDIVLFFLKENKFCTILDSFTNNIPAKEGIAAACDTAVIVLTKEQLTGLYEKLPYLKELIGGIVQQALLDKINTRNTYMGQDATTRYRHFLMHQPDIALRVSLSDVASYLGITQQSLSRIRKNFLP